MKTKFKHVKSVRELYHWEKLLKKAGDRKEKCIKIRKYAFKKFQNARNFRMNVHDHDLKRWACFKAVQLGLQFSTSKKWLATFKRMYGIVS